MTRRSIVAVVVATIALAATLASAPSASAQLDVDELTETEADLARQQAELEAQITETSDRLSTTEASLRRTRAEIGLLQRDIAAAHHVRDVALGALRSLAIGRYVLGDPRLEGFINEIVQEQASVSPAIERALYAQVLDGTESDLEASENHLEELRDSLSERVDEAEDLAAQVPVLRAEIDELGAARDASASELAAIREELDWERSLLRRAHLTGRDDGTDNERPVLAVKIDNVSAARPQTGINQADVVFEELVEGDLTRLVALFHSTGSDPVGPIRSVRTSDVHILANLNRPLLANSGANPGVMGALRESPIIDVGALSPTAGRFFRSSDRPAPNNLYSTTADLWAAGQGTEAGSAPPLFSFRRPNRPWGGDAIPSAGVNIDFGGTRVTYRWDEAANSWLRNQDGSPHVDTAGVQVTPTNVIVRITEYHPTVFAQYSPEAVVEGEGPVFVFSGGEVRTGTWKRDNTEAPDRYFDNEGNEIELLPGTTWIEIAPPDSVSLIS